MTRPVRIRFHWWAILPIVLVAAYAAFTRGAQSRLEVHADRTQLVAGGSSGHVSFGAEPGLSLQATVVEGRHSARIARTFYDNGIWRVTVEPKAMPGPVRIALKLPPYPDASLALTVTPNDRDPEPLRLDDPSDQAAFRSWFTFLVEANFFRDTKTLPAEISDCAALIRYAYREALREHDAVWSKQTNLPLLPAIPSIRKYEYPFTPWGAALFRTGDGNLRGEFADAATLLRWNTRFVSRDIRQARPGDLIFFRQEEAAMPYHSMIYLGPSQIENAVGPFLIYHTGPEKDRPGEIRRPSVEELRKHPDPSWHPVAENPHYLGVYRWNILWQ